MILLKEIFMQILLCIIIIGFVAYYGGSNEITTSFALVPIVLGYRIVSHFVDKK